MNVLASIEARVFVCVADTFKDMPHHKCWMDAVLVIAMMLVVSRQNAAAQPARSIAGSYGMEATPSPEGGTHFILQPDSTYVVVYFGGARAGRWNVVDDTLLYLTPTDVPAHTFALYGRRHAGLVGHSRIFYTGDFGSGGHYVRIGGLGAGRGQRVRRVFNEGANCTSFPNVDTVAGTPDSIVLVRRDWRQAEGRGDAYAFGNPARYNDFVAVATRREETAAMRGDEPVAAIRADGLYFLKSRHFARREEWEPGDEDRTFFHELTTANPDPDTVFYNPAYNEPDERPDGDELPFDLKNYRAAQGGDALETADYEEGGEYRADYDFHDMRMVYVFRAVQPVVARGVRFRVEGKPVFSFSCE